MYCLCWEHQAGQTPLSIAQRLGYISVVELLKGVTDQALPVAPSAADEKYKVLTPETMQEASMSESEDEGQFAAFYLAYALVVSR
jgi:ankyrin